METGYLLLELLFWMKDGGMKSGVRLSDCGHLESKFMNFLHVAKPNLPWRETFLTQTHFFASSSFGVAKNHEKWLVHKEPEMRCCLSLWAPYKSGHSWALVLRDWFVTPDNSGETELARNNTAKIAGHKFSLIVLSRWSEIGALYTIIERTRGSLLFFCLCFVCLRQINLMKFRALTYTVISMIGRKMKKEVLVRQD